MFERQSERMAIAAGEKCIFVLRSALPDRPNGVKDKLCGEPEAWSSFYQAGGTAVQFAAGFEQFRTGRAMDGSVNTAPAEERAVGGIHDGIHFQGRDVSEDGFEAHRWLDAPMHLSFGESGQKWRSSTIHLENIPRTE